MNKKGYITLEVTKKPKSSEEITKTLFKIANATNITDNLNDLYALIHKSLSNIIDATNFYIALYDKKNDIISFPYYADTVDGDLEDMIHASKSQSLTNEVIQNGKALFFKKKDMYARLNHKWAVSTTPAEVWLGAPLKTKNHIIGAIAVQSYESPDAYTQKDMDLLVAVSDQVALAIHRKLIEDSQQKSEAITKALFAISNAVNTTIDLNDLFESIHKSLGTIMELPNFYIALYDKKKDCAAFPYYVDEKDPKDSIVMVHNVSSPLNPSTTAMVIRSGKSLLLTSEDLTSHIRKIGRKLIGYPPAIWLGSPLKIKKEVIGVMVTQSYKDTHLFTQKDLELFNSVSDQVALAIERKRAQDAEAETRKINQALFSISNAVNTTESLDALYESIHNALKDIIDVTNFMIGLYDKEKDIISYPYYKDEMDDDFEEIKNVSKSGIVSWEVIKYAKPFFINKEQAIIRAKRIDADIVGSVAEQWLGIPLKIKREVVGVIVVQSYSNPELYSQKDIEILLSVSEQVAMAIDLKREAEAREKSEKINKTLFEIANAVNTTQSLQQLCNSINTSLEKVIHINNFSLALYDKKTDELSFLYRNDNRDLIKTIENASKSSSLTYEVIRKGELLLLDGPGQKKLINKLGGKMFGVVSQSLLCIPMKIKSKTIGAILTQDYEVKDRYKEKDIELLSLVSGQIALAIDRKRSQEALRKSKKQIENISNQIEQFSLTAASMISNKNPKKVFNKISRAIVKYSKFKKVVITYLTDTSPYHEILAYDGLDAKKIAQYRKAVINPDFFKNFLKKGEKIGRFSIFIQSLELKKIYNPELQTRYDRDIPATSSDSWPPNYMLFVRLLDISNNLIGFISVDDPISMNRPTDETVKPLEIFSSLVSQIIIYTKSQEELKIAKNAAEASAKSKSEFLANMSHEIRTPMNAIMGLTDLILQSDLDFKQRDYLEKIKSSSTSLLGIINDILDFSKIDAGKMDIENIDFRLNDVMDNLSDMFSNKTAEKEIEFIISISNDIPLNLIGDPLRLSQTLINLTGNAVKFTKKGEIIVSVSPFECKKNYITLEFIVKDTGVGIPKNRLNTLFDSFVQADGSTTRKYGGTGLGLSISKQLIELMGGSLKVKSKIGKGTEFSFLLSFKKKNKKTLGNKHIDTGLNNMKVLVVDDNKSAREILYETLTSFRFKVKTVDSGEKSIDELMQSHRKGMPFKLVILDLVMPKIDGIDTTKLIRESSGIADIPIIMMTGFGREEVMHQAKKAGVNAFLMKPVKHSLLLDTIMDVFAQNKDDHIPEDEKITNRADEPVKLNNLKVLLVEDNKINQLVASKILEGMGIIVTITSNGLLALKLLKKENFDIVLMDIQMPEMDGYTATREIRNKLNLKDLTIIAMTAHAMSGDKEKCLNAGMNDYISKPIDPEILYSKLLQYGKDKIITQTGETNKETMSDGQYELPDYMPGIDIKSGLSRFRGNTELFIELLKGFMDDYRDSTNKIRDLMQKKDNNEAENFLHGIKGVAGNLSMLKIYDISTTLESLLRENIAPDDALLDEYENALDEAYLSYDEINKNFNMDTARDIQINGQKFDQIDISDKVKLLYEKISDNDIEAIDILDIVKTMLQGKVDGDYIISLDKAINNFDFEEAKIMLGEIAKILQINLKGIANG